VLLTIVLLVGAIFFRVMAQFIVPLFLAAVLLVVFQPLHAWMLQRLPKHPRIAALLTTILILLGVLLPLTGLGWKGYTEFQALVNGQSQQGAQSVPLDVRVVTLAKDMRELFERKTHIRLNDETVNEQIKNAVGTATTFIFNTAKSAIGILVGLVIMVISLYYFLADGPGMIHTVMELSPLEAEYEQELLGRFGQVSRAVVVATLLSALVQGTLAGIGYYFALPVGAPIFLLTALTMVTAMIPFAGAALMWIPVCVWVYFYGERIVDGEVVQGNWVAALILTIYSTCIVSGVDNIIKPLVLRGQSNLHPLLALLSILGGVQTLGPVGILVGPMLVSFLQALLEMLRKELDSFGPVDANVVQVLAEGATPSTGEIAAAADPKAAKATTSAKSALPARRDRRRKR
jgi:predicted PurR-regulated permease PerM